MSCVLMSKDEHEIITKGKDYINMTKDKRASLMKLVERICDNYCVYRCTSDEEGSCQYMKENCGECYLDEITELIEE